MKSRLKSLRVSLDVNPFFSFLYNGCSIGRHNTNMLCRPLSYPSDAFLCFFFFFSLFCIDSYISCKVAPIQLAPPPHLYYMQIEYTDGIIPIAHCPCIYLMYCSYLLLSIFILQHEEKVQLPGVTVHLLHHYSWLPSPPDEGGEG